MGCFLFFPSSKSPRRATGRLERAVRKSNLKGGGVFAGIFLLLFCLVSCREKTVIALPPQATPNPKEHLVEAQKISARQERESIQSFVERSGWPMQESPSGLWYHIYHSGSPDVPKVERGDVVKITYTLRLLSGEIIASSEMDGPKTFVVGHSEVENGLEEAVLLMRQGESARLILPSHLAFGLSGDGERVPSQATLLYDITIQDVLISPEH